MRSLAARQLLLASRTPALAAACSFHAAAIGAFAIVWRNGMPSLPGDNVFEQQLLLQLWLLSALLPWAAARCLPARAADDVSATAAMAAVAPSRAAAAALLATFGILIVIALAGVAPVVLAQQISGVPFSQVLLGLVPLTALAAVAAPSSFLIALEGTGMLPTWIAAASITASATWIAGRSTGAWVTIAFLAIALAVAAMRRFDSTLLYPHEVRA
jgi:hypothetical protein